MADNGMIQTVSASALNDVDKLIEKVKNYNKEIERANRSPLGGGTGSNNRQVIAQIEELNRALAEQAQQIQRLTEVRQRSNQRTQEEITNQRLLAQNASRAAQANSSFANSYQRLTAQQAIAASKVQDLIARGRTAEQTQRQYNRELRNAQNEFNSLNARVTQADRAVGRFNRNVGNYGSAIGGLRNLIGAFGVVGGVTLFAQMATDIVRTGRELQSLDLALKNVTKTQETYAQTQEFLSKISEDYGIEIQGLTRSYTGFLAASQNAIESGKITSQQIQDIFQSVAKASGAMGLSVEQQQGAFLALQQMISKGNVQAEEIRGQLAERLPGAFGILAKSMKVTEEELNKLLKDGKVLAADVLPAFAKELEKAYGVENLERVESLAASTTRLGNAWTEFVRAVSSGEGTLSKVLIGTLEAIKGIVDGITELTKSEEQRRDNLLKNIEQGGYENQLALLKEMNKEEAKLAEYAAGETQRSGTARLAQLREERNQINQSLSELRSQGVGEGNIKIISLNNDYNSSLNETQLILGQIRAANEFLSKDEEKNAKKRAELSDKEKKRLAKLREDELQNQYRLRRLILESEQRGFEDVMKDTSLYYAQREQAAEDITGKEIELAELARKEGLRKAGQNKTLQLIVWEEYYKDYESIVKDGEERITKLREESFKEFQDYYEKFEGEGLKVLDRGALGDEWNERRKENAEKEKQRLKELRDATDDYLKSIRESFTSDAGLGSLNKFFDFDESGKSTFDKLIEGAENSREAFQVAFNAISEVAQETFNFLNQNSQAYFDAQYARLDREKDVRLKYAEGNAAAQAEIERQYDEERRKIRRKEAEQQKEQAIFNAIINTAQAVVAALPNVALSILVGAIGAAQIALISSQQIPAYKMGTDNHKGGLAIVGDGGRHEVVHQPTLGWSITPKTDTLVNLEKGSKVFPDLASSGIFSNDLPDMIALNGGGLTESQMDNIMSKYHASQVPYINIDKAGIRTFWRSESAMTENLNNRVRFNGRKK